MRYRLPPTTSNTICPPRLTQIEKKSPSVLSLLEFEPETSWILTHFINHEATLLRLHDKTHKSPHFFVSSTCKSPHFFLAIPHKKPLYHDVYKSENSIQKQVKIPLLPQLQKVNLFWESPSNNLTICLVSSSTLEC